MDADRRGCCEKERGQDEPERTERAPADYHVGFILTVLKKMVEGHLRKLRLDPEDYNIPQLINVTEIRNGLIRGKYRALDGNGEMVKEKYELLGKQFYLCDDAIKKIVEGRR